MGGAEGLKIWVWIGQSIKIAFHGNGSGVTDAMESEVEGFGVRR